MLLYRQSRGVYFLKKIKNNLFSPKGMYILGFNLIKFWNHLLEYKPRSLSLLRTCEDRPERFALRRQNCMSERSWNIKVNKKHPSYISPKQQYMRINNTEKKIKRPERFKFLLLFISHLFRT